MKKFFSKIDRWIVLLMIAVVLSVIFTTIRAYDSILINQQNEEIAKLSALIESNIDNAVSTEELIEVYLHDKLKVISEEIVEEIGKDNLDKFSDKNLFYLKEKNKLSGVALFKDYGDDIIIEKSTFEKEIGLSTKKWGFWYTAFRQLFDDDTVSINKGYSDGYFWAGPRSLAFEQEGYYIFTYYKIPGTNYLLNLYVNDKKAFGVVKSNDPNTFLEKLVGESTLIDEVALINVEAWNERFTVENRSKLQNYTIEYGYYTSFSPQDTYYLNRVNKGKEPLIVEQTIMGEKKTKIYSKLRENKVLLYSLNQDDRLDLRMNVLGIILIAIILIAIVTFIVIRVFISKYSKLLDVERSRLKLAEEYKHTVRILPSMIFRLVWVDNKILVKHCEGQAIKHLGINNDTVVNMPIGQVFPENYYLKSIEGINLGFRGISSEFEFETEDRIYQNRIEPIIQLDSHGIKEIVIFANDITKMRKSENKAKYMAYHDSLTDMPNRHYFKETVEKEILDTTGEFAVVFIDLDGFKNVNDTAGHDVGDILLKMVSYRINNELDFMAFAARMGGDEFAVLVRNYETKDNLIKVLDRLKNVISKEYTIREDKFKISASMGVSLYPENGTNYTALLKNSDIALYDVKYSGKNGYSFYKDK
ncbi:MAG: GGDEF domain-containing protein [Firmicutes bacterium]|jgi:diguanylate cyclase (GGDEF)-like protein|nr:GGDEF domain-containing protein [Bacillota bacterium]